MFLEGYMRGNDSEKDYDQYIRLHCGHEASHQKAEVVTTNFAKAIAASLLKNSKKAFNIDDIHKVSVSIRTMPEFNKIAGDPRRLQSCMADERTIVSAQSMIINKTYGVAPENITEYVHKMDLLYKNISVGENQSAEYKAFRAAVSSIRKLGMLNLATEQGRKTASEMLVPLNANLLSASERCIKKNQEQANRFDGDEGYNNTLDALRILAEYAPDTKDQIKVSVDKISRAPKAKEASPAKAPKLG